jgi:hypothetical protein
MNAAKGMPFGALPVELQQFIATITRYPSGTNPGVDQLAFLESWKVQAIPFVPEGLTPVDGTFPARYLVPTAPGEEFHAYRDYLFSCPIILEEP